LRHIRPVMWALGVQHTMRAARNRQVLDDLLS
jgi:hypothetical protein